MKIKIEISARHAHLSKEDLERLFGPGYELKKIKDLSQKGEFASSDKITVKGPKGQLEVRVLGPVRKKTQVEITKTEARTLGIDPPVRISGDHSDTPGALLSGPAGSSEIASGVIIAKRHIHCSPEEAEERGLKDGQTVSVRCAGDRGITFHETQLRTRDIFVWHMHIDTDEANAAGVDMQNNEGEVIA